MDDDAKKKCGAGDEVYINGHTEDGHVIGMRHTADHTLEPCVMLPMQEGKPLPPGAEFVRLKRKEGDRYSIQSIYKNGPAKVSSDSYREGWDRIFGGRAPRGTA